MKEHRPEILYSDPVKEIMGNPPARIVRWGTMVMFAAFVLLILFAWLIRYPDTIPAPVEITTSNPPVTLVTKITGNIKYVYVREKERVTAGQLLAVMETAASIDEIELLKHSIDTVRRPDLLDPRHLRTISSLGELEEPYTAFVKNLSELRNYIDNDLYGNKIKSLSDEIRGIQEYINRLTVKEKLFTDNQKLEAKKFRRDSLLFADRVIPESDLERSHQSLIRLNIDLQQVRLDHSQKSIELAEKRQLVKDYSITRVDDQQKLSGVLNQSFMNLKAQIKIWENTYLLISPVDGIVSFTQYWKANQTVLKDEPVVTVVPVESGNFLGRVSLKMQRSGKVKPGQKVNIKLSGYPYLEYGMVRGVVKSKSLVPSKEAYIIEIDLPEGLTTLYGMKLDFNQNMQGTAEIITEDVRLLQKIVNPFRYMISRNKR